MHLDSTSHLTRFHPLLLILLLDTDSISQSTISHPHSLFLLLETTPKTYVQSANQQPSADSYSPHIWNSLYPITNAQSPTLSYSSLLGMATNNLLSSLTIFLFEKILINQSTLPLFHPLIHLTLEGISINQ